MNFEIYTRPINTYIEQVSNSHELYPNALRISISELLFDKLESKYDLWNQIDSVVNFDKNMGYSIVKHEDAWINDSESLRAIIFKLDKILETAKFSHLVNIITELKIICETALTKELWVVFDF